MILQRCHRTEKMKLITNNEWVKENATYIPLQVQVGHIVFFDTFPVVDLGRIQFLQSKIKCISIRLFWIISISTITVCDHSSQLD